MKKSTTIILLSIGLFFITTSFVSADWEPEGLPFLMPGRVEGTGNYFEIKDSDYLDVSLQSTEEITIIMESIPEMVTINIERPFLAVAASSEIIITGFSASTTYYKYEDNYHILTEFTTDENGSYIYTQDISESHLVFIQPRQSTKFIVDDATGGDCTSIGSWNSITKTCTLTTDLNETIQIDSDDITLDGNGYTITGSNTGNGIFASHKSGVIIKNLNIRYFTYGIYFDYSNANQFINNSTIGGNCGIFLSYSNYNTLNKNDTASTDNSGIIFQYSNRNTIKENIASGNIFGIVLDNGSDYNTINNSTAYGNDYGICIGRSSSNNALNNNTSYGNDYGILLYEDANINTVKDNTLSDNDYGILVYYSHSNKAYHNNFINNSTQANVSGGYGNAFNYTSTEGGNYWSDYDTPGEGCTDANNNGFCDTTYYFSGGRDNYPFTTENGWEASSVPINEMAAILAKELVNYPYLWGGKGWDFYQSEFVESDIIKTGYNYWNAASGIIDFGVGVDCSGLVMWSYNRSFDSNKPFINNIIKYESADGQYNNNSEPFLGSEIMGDLMFFDWDFSGSIDHVAMYVEESSGYDVVNAADPITGIIGVYSSILKELPEFIAFQRVTQDLSPIALISAGSPVDIIVTDPDGFTITPDTVIQSEEEYLREIPCVLYYSEMEQGSDGNPIDRVYSPTIKEGDYIIEVIPDTESSPTDTYDLNFSINEETTVLADDVMINQIPTQGYGITVLATNNINLYIPVEIDIKPGSYSNSINLGSNGIVPVAIFGSATFDVKQIDPATIKLANASIKLKGNGQLMFNYSDINEDGFIDIVVKILTEDLQLTSSDVNAKLVGQLINGTTIKGSDFIRIVP